jgi:membrane protease YdiL (CAAX protease family)
MIQADRMTSAPNTRARLMVEFGVFFILTPVLIAVLLPATMMFPALFAFTALGIALLHFTPGFAWAELRYNWRGWTWKEVLLFSFAVAVICFGVIQATRPDAAFFLLRNEPALLAFIWIGYPLVSALPQELLFRTLFFRRYGTLLPDGQWGGVLNAGLFSLAHLMYWSWIVAILTFAGGLLFSYAYRQRGSFFLAVLLHAIAGNLLFAVGLGVYFYSGNVVRPF